MVNKILNIHDKVWEKVIQWLTDRLHISLIPTFVRFATIPFLISVSTFFIAIAVSTYALYLYLKEGSVMVAGLSSQTSATMLFWITIVAAIIGILFFFISCSLVLYYLRHQNVQPPDNDAVLKNMSILQGTLKTLDTNFNTLITEIKGMRQDLKDIKGQGGCKYVKPIATTKPNK